MIIEAGTPFEELSQMFQQKLSGDKLENFREKIKVYVRATKKSIEFAKHFSHMTGAYYVGQVVQLDDGPNPSARWIILKHFDNKLGYYLAAPFVDDRNEKPQVVHAQMIYNPAPVRFFRRLFDDPENAIRDAFDLFIPYFDNVKGDVAKLAALENGDVKDEDLDELMEFVKAFLPALKEPVANAAAAVVKDLVDYTKTHGLDPIVMGQQLITMLRSEAAKI